MKKLTKNKVSIIVPCYDEEEALPLFYNKASEILTDNNIAMKAAADYFDMYGKYAESVGEQNAKDFVKTV